MNAALGVKKGKNDSQKIGFISPLFGQLSPRASNVCAESTFGSLISQLQMEEKKDRRREMKYWQHFRRALSLSLPRGCQMDQNYILEYRRLLHPLTPLLINII
jgi:hypothetical protein